MEVLYVNFSHYMCQRGLYNASCNAPPHVVELDKKILAPNSLTKEEERQKKTRTGDFKQEK